MRKLILAAIIAPGIALAPMAAMPAQASVSSSPTVTASISCTGYEIQNGLSLFLYNASGIVRLHNSGNPTRYCVAADGTTGYLWLAQDNTNLCLTYNASHNYIDEITCSTTVTAQRWQEASFGNGTEEWINNYNNECLSGAVVNNPALLNVCKANASSTWHFA